MKKVIIKYNSVFRWMFVVLFFVSIFSAPTVFAAEVIVEYPNGEIYAGDQVEVSFLVTSQESINVIEGSIKLPSSYLIPVKINSGNSVISFWLSTPNYDENSQSIFFTGVTPGGFKGNNGLLFTVTFETLAAGSSRLVLTEGRAFKHDGTGTEIDLIGFPILLVVRESIAGRERVVIEDIQDSVPPEQFALLVSRDESIFNGDWFVTFTSQDKSSGIAQYEIQESRQRFLKFNRLSWNNAVNPQLLGDQKLLSYITVRAIDYAGNMRIARVRPMNPHWWYRNYENWIILGVVLYILWLCIRHMRKVRLKKYS